jgi:hypothetical protein
MPLQFRFAFLLIAIGTQGLVLGSFPSHGEDRLRPTADVISQKYCSADNELFRVDTTLHLKFENHTDKVLILDKQFGKLASRSIIAKNSESLANRDYEYDPIFDSIADDDPPDFHPSIHLLHSNFVLLAPGQSFESVSTVAPR